MTFSIVARDPRSGHIGIGAVTAMVGVGKLVTHARAGIGAIATQANINPYLALDGLALLGEGRSAQEALDVVIAEDPGAAYRQCGVVDAEGRTAVWTGEQTPDWSGHVTAEDVAVQGNRLVGRETVEAVLDRYRERDDLDLPWRILVALEAGEATGADKKGAVSANIAVMATEEYPLWDVRVDEADDPVARVRELMEQMAEELVPQVEKLSTRQDPLGQLTREMMEQQQG
jgi:uncharacterized Ntn-hydrolase superfamily protein